MTIEKLTAYKETAFNRNHRKEHGGWYRQMTMQAIMPGPHGSPVPYVMDVVTIRFYMPGRTTVYCAFWINGILTTDRTDKVIQPRRSGTGTAGGYGYDKASAAFSDALTRAGIHLSEAIDGRGESAIREAMEVLAKEACPDALAFNFHLANP